MSGLCGIFNLDGASADERTLQRLTALLSFRGPDAQHYWAQGAVGLGHTLLRTTFRSAGEHQPFSLDQKVWIVADARIDGQSELRQALAHRGFGAPASAHDAQLIVHAYQAWGDDCVHHLLGDFAFALWDGPRHRMLCARDPLGIKPFFYAHQNRQFVFSNTLNCIRAHPSVSDRLSDVAIADFLLFGCGQDPATTTFADIQRLPPGHRLTCTADGIRIARYWSLPTDLGVRYRDAGDYVEHFKELLEQAVSDRLQTDRVGISMSGGLDSTAIAATAHRLLAGHKKPFALRAHAVVFDHLIPDDERRFAGLAAQHIGIPIDYLAADDYGLYQGQRDGECAFPEPLHDPELAVYLDSARQAADHSRVVLTGWDGDALLNESPKPFLRSLLRQRKYLSLLQAMARYGVMERRLIPLSLRDGWRKPERQAPSDDNIPRWIAPGFAKRVDLESRWRWVNTPVRPPHPIRPYAYQVFDLIERQSSFLDSFDAASTRCALEFRHPLMDLRLVTYCLAIPPMPWCVKKNILRAASAGMLPEAVRLRPKTPLAHSPWEQRLLRPDSAWLREFRPSALLEEYVQGDIIKSTYAGLSAAHSWVDLRALSLDCWLKSLNASAV